MTSHDKRTVEGNCKVCGRPRGFWSNLCHDEALDETRAQLDQLRAENAALLGLLREVRPFVDHNVTAVVNEFADRFYRDTGVMAPGKSVPMEMANSIPDDATRRERYIEWLKVHRDAFTQAIDAALSDKETAVGDCSGKGDSR